MNASHIGWFKADSALNKGDTRLIGHTPIDSFHSPTMTLENYTERALLYHMPLSFMCVYIYLRMQSICYKWCILLQ